jgi:hypothetical protein
MGRQVLQEASMNARTLRFSAATALVLALSACAGAPAKIEDPHHYSKDREGNRTACYATETANEYECVPVTRRYAHSRYEDPFWDPWWSYGFGYSWYGGSPWMYPPHGGYYPYPAYADRHRRAPRR